MQLAGPAFLLPAIKKSFQLAQQLIWSFVGKLVKSVPHTRGYIYLLAIILALPATWLLVGRSGEDVPGMIAMVVTIVFFGIFTLALGSLHRRLQNRHHGSRAPSR
jgi:hypothetical protein